MTVQFDWHARPGPGRVKAQLMALALRLHILLFFLEFPKLRLDGNGSLLCLRVLHVDVKVLRDVVFLFIYREKCGRAMRWGLRLLHKLFCAIYFSFQAVLMMSIKLLSHLPFLRQCLICWSVIGVLIEWWHLVDTFNILLFSFVYVQTSKYLH